MWRITKLSFRQCRSLNHCTAEISSWSISMYYMLCVTKYLDLFSIIFTMIFELTREQFRFMTEKVTWITKSRVMFCGSDEQFSFDSTRRIGWSSIKTISNYNDWKNDRYCSIIDRKWTTNDMYISQQIECFLKFNSTTI